MGVAPEGPEGVVEVEDEEGGEGGVGRRMWWGWWGRGRRGEVWVVGGAVGLGGVEREKNDFLGMVMVLERRREVVRMLGEVTERGR